MLPVSTCSYAAGMRVGRYHHGDLRAALLERAEQTLRDKGVEALSLRELARDLCVSHSAPSRHFRDKRALLDALALAGFGRLSGALDEIDAEDIFAARLTAFARIYVDFAGKHAALLDVMFARKHASGQDELYAAWLRLEVATHTLITDGQRAGAVRAGNVDRIAVVVFTALHGVATLTASGLLTGEPADHVFEDVLTHLIRGLAPAANDTPLA
jgi:AcrR family transcriptional regulator